MLWEAHRLRVLGWANLLEGPTIAADYLHALQTSDRPSFQVAIENSEGFTRRSRTKSQA